VVKKQNQKLKHSPGMLLCPWYSDEVNRKKMLIEHSDHIDPQNRKKKKKKKKKPGHE
jgi:uncharacterized protein YodC (DUF2158 family)